MSATIGTATSRPSLLAISSFVLGLMAIAGSVLAFLLMLVLVGFVLFPFVALIAFAGLGCAVVALTQSDRSRGFAWAGLTCNALVLLPALVILLTSIL